MDCVICSKTQYRGQWCDAHVFVLSIHPKANWNAIHTEHLWIKILIFFGGGHKVIIIKIMSGWCNCPDSIMDEDALNEWKSSIESLLKHTLARSFIIISYNFFSFFQNFTAFFISKKHLSIKSKTCGATNMQKPNKKKLCVNVSKSHQIIWQFCNKSRLVQVENVMWFNCPNKATNIKAYIYSI